jgi:hypothetical protein
MKLSDAAEFLKEVDAEDKKRPPAISGAATISTAQAASPELLGVSVSRVRQLIGSGDLTPVVKPRKGDRDHELLKKDVDNYKKKIKKGDAGQKGRPPESEEKDEEK